GVDGIWLSPTFPSPNKDWGYDVADYLAVHPELGTLEDLDELVAAAADSGIRVLLDLVPNHTSDQHPWFLDSRSSRSARHRDWYVWRDPGPDGVPPNNWRSAFGGPAWTLDAGTGQLYLHQFLPEQPDLNWWNDQVRATYVLDVGQLPPYFGDGDELHLAFNFRFLHAPFEVADLAEIVEQTEAVLPARAWPLWTASNHDISRFPSRWCGGSDRLARCALLMLVTLRGTPFLYQGDEIAMLDGKLTQADLRDPAGVRGWPRVEGRD